MSDDISKPDLSHRSAADLIKSVTELVPRLVKEELALGKLELQEKGKRAGLGAGMFGAAGVVAWFALGTLVATAVLGLANAVDAWLAALIVAVVLLVVAGILALVGKSQISKAVPPAPEEAIASTKEDVRVIKESAHQ